MGAVFFLKQLPVMVYGFTVFDGAVSFAGAVLPVLKASGTEDPAGDTRT